MSNARITSCAGEIRLSRYTRCAWILHTTRTYFCSLFDFFIFVGRCNKVRGERRGEGEGAKGGPRIPNLIAGRKGSEY